MSIQFYWFIERRDLDGVWHGVLSTRYTMDIPDERDPLRWSLPRVFGSGFVAEIAEALDLDSEDSSDNGPFLSGVAADADTKLLFEAAAADDGFGWHHIDGKRLQETASHDSLAKRFLSGMELFLQFPEADHLLPDAVEGDYWKGLASSSGHETLRRKAIERRLAPWRTDPSSWRVSFYFTR